MTRLDSLIAATRDAVAARRSDAGIAAFSERIAALPEGRPFREALVRPGLSLIAEHKRRSPSAGLIREGSTVAEVVTAYERGGAAALSVLTEEAHFGGSLDDLVAAREAVALPLLAKNFHIDTFQLYESAAAGADAALIVVASVDRQLLRELYECAHELDLDALVEVHTREELEVALELDADVIGINNRDLADFTIDIERTYELLTDVPAGKTVVSESGFSTRDQLDRLEAAGVDAVLIGEALMRADDLEAACKALTHGGEHETSGDLD